MATWKSRKRSGFVVYSHLKNSAFEQLRGMKGLPFVNRRYTKGVTFLSKMLNKRVRGWMAVPTGLVPRDKTNHICSHVVACSVPINDVNF